MNKIDRYIIKKFLSTFFFTLFLLIMIIIVIDYSENYDDFNISNLNFSTIFFQYYIYLIPYYANLLSPLFIFISVIFFTSRLANNSEIIAIYNSGMSFNRLLRPFIIASILLSIISFLLSNFIIPLSNKSKMEFESQYQITKSKKEIRKSINKESKENQQYININNYNHKKNKGWRVVIYNVEKDIENIIKAGWIQWNEKNQNWIIPESSEINTIFINKQPPISTPIIRPKDLLSNVSDTVITLKNNLKIICKREKIEQYNQKNIYIENLNLSPDDFIKEANSAERMTLHELNKNIKNEEKINSGNLRRYKIEKNKRIAFPFAIIILTLIAVSLSIKKKKSGIAYNIGIGLLISFSYLLLFEFSKTFALRSNLEPWIAVWIPNFIYILLSILLLRQVKYN